MRLAVLASHPIQYQAPLFRALARETDLTVYFAHEATARDQAAAGFGVTFTWDVDLLGGYRHEFLSNQARSPDPSRFFGCDTPSIGMRLRAGGYNALLVTGWHLKSYWQGIGAARRLGLPVLVRGDSHLETPRGMVKRFAKTVLYPPALLHAFDAALYVGQRSRAYYEHYRFPQSRLFFSPHCVDNEWFAARATPEARLAVRQAHAIAPETKVVLFAGKLMDLKRPLDVVRAAGKLVGEGRTLTVMIAGAGDLRAEVERQARALGVPLAMLGFCNQSQMPAAYAASDALVLPSEQETWGLVANEALASGVPVIVSRACGCAPDLAEDGKAGRVFAAGDVDALATALGELLDAPPERASLERKIDAYSIAAAVNGIRAALEATAGSGRALTA